MYSLCFPTRFAALLCWKQALLAPYSVYGTAGRYSLCYSLVLPLVTCCSQHHNTQLLYTDICAHSLQHLLRSRSKRCVTLQYRVLLMQAVSSASIQAIGRAAFRSTASATLAVAVLQTLWRSLRPVRLGLTPPVSVTFTLVKRSVT